MSLSEIYIPKAETWLAKQGLAMAEFLGSGTFSSVWGIEGRDSAGKAFKISTDDEEWLALPLVKAAQDDGKARAIVRVHKFEQVCKGAMFALVERLEPLSKEDKRAFHQCVPSQTLPGPWEVHSETVYDPDVWWDGYDGMKYKGRYISKPIDNPFHWTSAVQINAVAINQSLVEAGIKGYHDWHGENIMRRPGYGVVICDLGRVTT